MYTLLLVDDETPILEGLRRTLDWKSYGFHRVETASTYEDAMTKAIDLNPDIAVFDVCIGPHRGYEIINHLKKMGLKTIYIMMSGYSDFEFARESLRCGAKEYLLKPIDTEKLRELIETVIVRDLHGTVSQRSINHVDMDPVLQLPYGAFPPLINKIQMLVQENYQQNLSLKIIADKFKMNSTYLGQLFLKEVRLKFSEYLMLYRLTASRDLILQTDDKISYIALSVGYGNLNYFYQQFHDYFNMSPLELRKNGGKFIPAEPPHS